MKNQGKDLEETEDERQKEMEVRHLGHVRRSSARSGRRVLFLRWFPLHPGLEQTETGEISSQGGAAGYYRREGEGKHGHGPQEDRGVDDGERQSRDPTNQGGEGGVGEEPEKDAEHLQLVQSQQEVKLTQETFNVSSLNV